MKKTHWSIAGIVLLMLLFGGAWAMGMFRSEDPKVTELKAKAAALMGEEGKKLTPEQRRKGMQELRAQAEALPPEQRQQAFEAGRQHFQQRMEQHMAEFFKLPKDKQLAALDKEIDQNEARRKEREKRRAERNANGKGGNNGSRSGQTAGAPGNGKGGPWGGGRGRRTEDQRNQWRKRMLDNTSPETRSQFREYRRLMAERQKQRGLPTSGRW